MTPDFIVRLILVIVIYKVGNLLLFSSPLVVNGYLCQAVLLAQDLVVLCGPQAVISGPQARWLIYRRNMGEKFLVISH